MHAAVGSDNVRVIAAAIREHTRGDLSNLYLRTSTLDRCLWVLAAAKDCGGSPRLSAKEVHALLGDLEVACSQGSVAMALHRASDKEVVRFDGATPRVYGISSDGRQSLERNDPTKGIEVWCAQPGRKWSAWQKIDEMCSEISGELCITDPYYGMHSLDVLEMMARGGREVRLLTCQASARKGVTSGQVVAAARLLAKQHPNIQIRVVPHPAPFHDRYLLWSNGIVIVGHGLEGLGEKEAFVIRLEGGLVQDMLSDLRIAFDSRWASAVPA